MATQFDVRARIENSLAAINTALAHLRHLHGCDETTNEFAAGTPLAAIRAINDLQDARTFAAEAVADLRYDLEMVE